jgi:hypothetical protein
MCSAPGFLGVWSPTGTPVRPASGSTSNASPSGPGYIVGRRNGQRPGTLAPVRRSICRVVSRRAPQRRIGPGSGEGPGPGGKDDGSGLRRVRRQRLQGVWRGGCRGMPYPPTLQAFGTRPGAGPQSRLRPMALEPSSGLALQDTWEVIACQCRRA